MQTHDVTKNPEEALTRVLSKFDKASKDTLSVELVKAFNIPSESRGYRKYIETVLGRSLTSQETFRVDTLMALVKFHGVSIDSRGKSARKRAAKKAVKKMAKKAAKKAAR